jgi:hypothetical protein
LKFQCLPININNKTTCECANRRIPCHANDQENQTDENCENQFLTQQKRELILLKAVDGKVNSIIFESFIIALTRRFPNRIITISIIEVRQ